MFSPRVYWVCPHETLRYEEVPLFIEGGAEVIPNFGDPVFLRYFTNYNNENDMLCPNWRRSCTIPANVVEKIREIELWKKKGKVTSEEAELINQWIDVIFISTFVEYLSNISKWFRGYVVFRAFGMNDGITSYTEAMNRANIDIDKIAVMENYVWCPILNSLEDREDSRIIKNKYYLNAFASEERVKFKWMGKDSKPFISTTISYLDHYYYRNRVVKENFDSFKKEFSNIPFVVLGKNTKNAAENICDKVIGDLDHNSFFSKIAESRIFVYIGLGSNYHLHFTPIEAITMGVPVVFLEKSGLAQEARDNGIRRGELKKIGMCETIKDMKKFAQKVMYDFEKLYQLVERQSNIFSKIFSREKALARTKEFFKTIQPYIEKSRKRKYEPIYYNLVEKHYFGEKNIEEDLPTKQGEKISFSVENINAFSGKAIYDHGGKFICRRVEKGVDPSGLFIGNYITKMEPGKYLFSMELNIDKTCYSSLGTFQIGVWSTKYNGMKVLSSKEVLNLNKGKNIISIDVEITPENSKELKEIDFIWNGILTCEVMRIIVEKIV